MQNNKLKKIFSQLAPVSDQAWSEFEGLIRPKELKKGEFLLREGEQANDVFFLTEGIIRVFYSKDGNEYNKTFFVKGMFPTALTSLLMSEPSQLGFQALADCTLLAFDYRAFRGLFDKHEEFLRIMLAILENMWIKKERHDIYMVTNDATTNYRIFQEQYPGLEMQIPQYHIASYLGITAIQLSRIRAKLAKS